MKGPDLCTNVLLLYRRITGKDLPINIHDGDSHIKHSKCVGIVRIVF